MSPLEVLAGKWQLMLSLAVVFVSGVAVGQVIFIANNAMAFRLLDWLDAKRKPVIQILHGLLYSRHGVAKAVGFIFAVNLLGASFLQHSLGGLIVAPPFIFLFTGGLLISLLVRRYPERLLITAVVAPFEFGAFMIAATGGVGIGLSLWRGGATSLAVHQWAVLFVALVVPLQVLNAFLEAWLAHRQFVVQDRPWPQ